MADKTKKSLRLVSWKRANHAYRWKKKGKYFILKKSC